MSLAVHQQLLEGRGKRIAEAAQAWAELLKHVGCCRDCHVIESRREKLCTAGFLLGSRVEFLKPWMNE